MEIWDILDEAGNKTGKTMKKGEPIPEGFYHLGADVWIVNSENKILIQKRSPQKRSSPNVWAMTGGSVIKGETSLQTIEREVQEELGIQLNIENLQLVKHYKTGTVWLDTYFVRQNINLADIVMQEAEVSEVKWATYDEIEEIFEADEFIENRWEYVRNLMKCVEYIGSEIDVEIDRPLGSSHSKKYPDHIYPVNYGFVPNTISGDGKEIDCYILGEDKPFEKYKGKCIAVVHRINDEDDKLILAPQGKSFTDEEIKSQVDFQEKYYKSVVIR